MSHLLTNPTFATWLWIAALLIVLLIIVITTIRHGMQTRRLQWLAQDVAISEPGTWHQVPIRCDVCQSRTHVHHFVFGPRERAQEVWLCQGCLRRVHKQVEALQHASAPLPLQHATPAAPVQGYTTRSRWSR